MKNFSTFFLGSAALLAVACSTPSANQWELVWQDNFDSTAIDTATWTRIERGGADWNNFMASYDQLYDVSNGIMTLYGIKNRDFPADTATYLTGGVYTKGKRFFENGRLEIRAKLSSNQGFWPAIWLLPKDAKWPNGGEIDIMEHLNHDSIVYQTVHSQYTLKHGIKDNPLYSVSPKYKHNDWNVYGVELYKDSLCFLLNDVKTHTYPRIVTDIPDQFPFADEPFYLLIDAQLGGGWVGAVDSLQLPATMEIDWVKFYQKK